MPQNAQTTRKSGRKATWLTAIEYAQRCGVSRQAVYEWKWREIIQPRKDGKINAEEADAELAAYRERQKQTVPWWNR